MAGRRSGLFHLLISPEATVRDRARHRATTYTPPFTSSMSEAPQCQTDNIACASVLVSMAGRAETARTQPCYRGGPDERPALTATREETWTKGPALQAQQPARNISSGFEGAEVLAAPETNRAAVAVMSDGSAGRAGDSSSAAHAGCRIATLCNTKPDSPRSSGALPQVPKMDRNSGFGNGGLDVWIAGRPSDIPSTFYSLPAGMHQRLPLPGPSTLFGASRPSHVPPPSVQFPPPYAMPVAQTYQQHQVIYPPFQSYPPRPMSHLAMAPMPVPLSSPYPSPPMPFYQSAPPHGQFGNYLPVQNIHRQDYPQLQEKQGLPIAGHVDARESSPEALESQRPSTQSASPPPTPSSISSDSEAYSPSSPQPKRSKTAYAPAPPSQQRLGRKHICHVCSRPFGSSSQLARHRRIHMDVKPFECWVPGCGARFCRVDNMKSHATRHEARVRKEGGWRKEEAVAQSVF